MACILDLRAERLSRELPDRLDKAERAAGSAGLADQQLAARRVERKAAIDLKTMATNEVRSFALGAKAEILDLQDVDHGIVVIGLDQVDIGRPDAGRFVQAIAVHHPAAAILPRI